MERRQVTIWGVVQGVGFRPLLYQLATQYQLAGFVANRQGRVELELEGPGERIQQLLDEALNHPPPGAVIDGIASRLLPVTGERGFSIRTVSNQTVSNQTVSAEPFCIQPSTTPQLNSPPLPAGRASSLAWLAPDRAICADCRDELTDPASRRSGYALTSCTVCGPRLTLARRQPYERQQSSLADFPLCERCQADYDNPCNRRFHAETSSCPYCGPRLELQIHSTATTAHPTLPDDRAILRWISEQLCHGAVVALKGIGGYHLVCDAHNPAAVRRLRSIKRREARPLAVMVRDLACAERWCELTTAERQWLTSPVAPIVLVRHHTSLPEVMDAHNPLLGIMLPYSPLHHLLMQELGEQLLVMTSANESAAPILVDDERACELLSPHVDAIVLHRRRIEMRCDDSVVRLLPDGPLIIRRSRGFVPQPLPLNFPCREPILAVGGQAKSVFAYGLGQHALLSQHLGDLDDWSTAAAFASEIAHWEQLFEVRPNVLAHDPHPDYAATRYAERRAESEQIRLIPVQHHHAHFASCLTEHQLAGPAIGIILDGTGWGLDLVAGRRAIWGGEILVGDASHVHRAAHLRYVALPGGERAVLEPWRMALSHLLDAGFPPEYLYRFFGEVPTSLREQVATLIARPALTAPTSSAGRLFDAVSYLLGWRGTVAYEGQAAEWLEWRALQHQPDSTHISTANQTSYDAPHSIPAAYDDCDSIDTRPLLQTLVSQQQRGVSASALAWWFHDELARLLVASCEPIRAATGLNRIALSGGVFLNALLTARIFAHAQPQGWQVFRQQQVPPSDAGLCLGQLAVAQRQL